MLNCTTRVRTQAYYARQRARSAGKGHASRQIGAVAHYSAFRRERTLRWIERFYATCSFSARLLVKAFSFLPPLFFF